MGGPPMVLAFNPTVEITETTEATKSTEKKKAGQTGPLVFTLYCL
ncbi:MAG: hypothetical protein JWP03_3273 [Phycisphaerales bacterium]|jgi:hypothetical protein|nr:hypothetical protein [Phycisphaerales bacterium]